MSEKLWYLKRCELFQPLSPDQAQRLGQRSRLRSFAAKSPIYLPADNSDNVFLLATGRAKVCHLTEDGKQSILAFVEPGELFGELALLEAGRREEYVEAVEPSTVLTIPGDAILQLMHECPEISLGMVRLIGLRRRRIERRLKQLLFLSNRQRLTHLLLELAEQYGAATSAGIDLRIRLSHQDLANIIGSTRETVTLVLGRMQLEGFVRVRRRRITLIDPERLARSVERPTPAVTGGNAVIQPKQAQFAAGLLA